MSGLTESEVQTRLKTHGLNEVAREKRLTPLRRLYNVFKNPLVILLSILAAISLATGDPRSAIVILVMVILGTSLRYVQEALADNAARNCARSLQQRLLSAATGKIRIFALNNWFRVM